MESRELVSWDWEEQDYDDSKLQINLALAVVVEEMVSVELEPDEKVRGEPTETENDG